MKIDNLQNINFKILKDFSLDLKYNDDILDVVVLAGINGSGKTTILDFIHQRLRENKFELKGRIYFEFNNEIKKSNNIVNNILLHDKLKIAVNELEKKIIYIKAKDNNLNDLKNSIKQYIKYMIFDKEVSPKETYAKVNQYLKEIFCEMELSISFSGLDKYENIYFKNSFNQKVLIDDLSTGEKEILNKLFYFFIENVQDSLILIDEPEISLHPTWQSYIFKVYKNLATKFNNQIIIATHSPQLVASTPNENLIILTKEDERIVAKNYNAYGKDINSILVDIMGVGYLRDIDVEKQIEKVKEMMFKNNFENNIFKKEFAKLENMLENDNIELSLIKFELQRRKDAPSR